VNPQAPPSHVGAPLAGTGQGAQLAPQELTLLSFKHCPLQSCVPGAHWFMQGSVDGMQAPAQRNWSAGHLPPHLSPSQVAVPPAGAAQAEQEVPQFAGSLLSTHCPPHRWKPLAQERAHA
jgi:hypothetical protein